MNINNKVRTSYPDNAEWIANTTTNIAKWTNITGGQMLAERVLQDYAVTCLPSATRPSGNLSKDVQRDLTYLDLKLDAVRKTITTWDIYNIRGVADDQDDTDILLSTATPNTSFIVNHHIDKDNTILKQELYPGDIVFTDLNNQNNIIRHGASGYFYPAAWERLGEAHSYKLTYKWTAEPRILDQTKALDVEPLTKAYDQVTMEAQQETNAGFLFSIRVEPGETKPVKNAPESRQLVAIALNTAGEKVWTDHLLQKYETPDAKHKEKGWYVCNDTNMPLYVEVR